MSFEILAFLSKQVSKTSLFFTSPRYSEVLPLCLFIAQNITQRVLIFVVLSPFFVAIFVITSDTYRLFEDLKSNKVVAQIGYYQLPMENINPSQNLLWLGGNDPEISISGEVFATLEVGKWYTAYYLPKSRKIVSMEICNNEAVKRELKDELKYLDAKQAELKTKNDES